MYHLFSFPRDEKDKRQMLILDIINFVFTSKQSYKFLSIVKGIIYWSATLQYQDEFLCFSRQSNLCYTVFKIFANKQKSFLQVVFDMKTKETHFFPAAKIVQHGLNGKINKILIAWMVVLKMRVFLFVDGPFNIIWRILTYKTWSTEVR